MNLAEVIAEIFAAEAKIRVKLEKSLILNGGTANGKKW